MAKVAGSYLASEAEERLYLSEIEAEGREIIDFPERETAELAVVLEKEGLPRQQAETVARGLAANPNVFLRTKVEKELGLSADAGGAALGDALVVGLTYLAAAVEGATRVRCRHASYHSERYEQPVLRPKHELPHPGKPRDPGCFAE